MKILNRNWKKSKSKNCEIHKVEWDNNYIIIEYVAHNSREDMSIVANLRKSKKVKVMSESLTKYQKNGRIYYKAIFDINKFGNQLNSVWDFYTSDELNKTYRIKCYIDFSNNLPFKVLNEPVMLKPYCTVENNFSISIVPSKSFVSLYDISLNNNFFNISSEFSVYKEVQSISIFGNDEEYIEKYSQKQILSEKNNFNIFQFKLSYPIEFLLNSLSSEKQQSLRFYIKFVDGTEEYISIEAPSTFIKNNFVYKNNKISIYKNDQKNIFIRVQTQGPEAQVTNIFSYNDRFEINGFIDNLLSINKKNSWLYIENRESKEYIQIPIKVNKKNRFTAQIEIKYLVKNNIFNGVFDLYFISDEIKLRLESSRDDIENKQKVMNIPQQMRGNRNDTYVYKIYYTLENEVSLLVRKYMTIKRINRGLISSNKIILEGDFFVEPPLQLLPEQITGYLTIVGYYNRVYRLPVNINTRQTNNKYYTHFILDSDISHLDNIDKLNIKGDLQSNTIKLELKVQDFLVTMTGVVDGKGIVEETNLINQYIKYKKTVGISRLYKLFNKVIPINPNVAIYQSFHGKSYSCSPKAIHEEMIKIKENYTGVWVLENEYTEVPNGTIIVKPNTLRYYYYMACAKYFINNGNFPDFYEKRKGTVHLQTWHGTPLKKLGYDISLDSPSYHENNSPELIRRNKRWDYLIGPNEYTSNILKRAFGFDKKMLDVGYPRNDIL